MNIYDIIEKKKHGLTLKDEEIKYVVKEFTNDIIPDYQMAALLMAIYFNGLDVSETYTLTEAMIESGDKIDLSKIDGKKVDKHSTGGVGDTTTLVLGPMVASLGVPFAKMSGRGLGHTGGTLDKLESIPGMHIDLSTEELINNTNEIKIAIAGQTSNITPADKKLYALRDTTATVDNISLITSSILSKKFAMGADSLVLDVKVGSGAFMKDIESAEELSKMMIDVSKKFNRHTKILITSMEEPLGYAIGNALEVIEAIETLKGNGPKDLYELCLKLGSKLLIMSGKCLSEDEAVILLEQNIKNGLALEKFIELVEKQGGDSSYIKNPSKFILSETKIEVISDYTGYVKSIDALLIGEVARDLGAGRLTKDTVLDLGAGIVLNKKIDDKVNKGDLLATFYTNKNEEVSTAIENIKSAYQIGEKNKDPYKLIYKEIE